MQKKWVPLCCIVVLLFAAGCETAKGMKKDLANTWNNAQTWDEWVKENLW